MIKIKLQSQLGIQIVSDLKAELETAIAADEGIVLDASAVETVDSAALQLLVALVQYAALKKCDIEWREPASAFLEAVKLMGLNGALHV
jgi:anti-anti-sigma regulatory factor